MKQKYQILFFAFVLIMARVFGGKIKGDTMILVSPLIPDGIGKFYGSNTALAGVKYIVIASSDAILGHEIGHTMLARESISQRSRSLANEVFCDLYAVKSSGATEVLHMLNVLTSTLRDKATSIRKWSTFFGTGNFGKRYESIMEGYASVFDKGVEELLQRRKFVIALTIKGDESVAEQFNACFPRRALRHLV